LLQEKLETITAVNIIDEEYAFALDELQLKDDICEEELVDFGTSGDAVVCKSSC
jgi:hypothetical protein